MPPLHVRQMRQLLSQRTHLVETYIQIVNRMHRVAHRHHLTHERGKRFNEKNTGWQKDKTLSSLEQFQLRVVRDVEKTGELFRINTGFGTERDKVPRERHHKRGMSRTEMDVGRSGTDGGEVGPGVEDAICVHAKADAPQSGNRGNRATAPGVGLVCVDAPLTLSPLQSGTDRLQVSDVVLADG